VETVVIMSPDLIYTTMHMPIDWKLMSDSWGMCAWNLTMFYHCCDIARLIRLTYVGLRWGRWSIYSHRKGKGDLTHSSFANSRSSELCTGGPICF